MGFLNMRIGSTKAFTSREFKTTHFQKFTNTRS